MMEKQKFVLEMAKDICRVKLNCNDVCNPISACDALKYAERAYEVGYRKQSEVAREIFGEIEKLYLHITNEFDLRRYEELKKKYTEGKR